MATDDAFEDEMNDLAGKVCGSSIRHVYAVVAENTASLIDARIEFSFQSVAPTCERNWYRQGERMPF